VIRIQDLDTVAAETLHDSLAVQQRLCGESGVAQCDARKQRGRGNEGL
jgi:hypothetical protein